MRRQEIGEDGTFSKGCSTGPGNLMLVEATLLVMFVASLIQFDFG